jgi:hypothetical protein
MPDSPLERLKIDDRDRMIDVNTSRVCSPVSPLARLAASGRPRSFAGDFTVLEQSHNRSRKGPCDALDGTC